MRAILLAILDLGSAQNPHVLRVRSGFCALSVSKLAAPITPNGIGSKIIARHSWVIKTVNHSLIRISS
ncbi:hypothetical protein AW74_18450 [Salmonella enterica subsp. enterica serovar Montevideo str. CDC 2011K-1674]|nr:hypothetical protein LFZ3_15170 [Salmonella enterica subsp. enterica serovar Bergen str. ST350]ARI68009.1 hypothetical protein AW70_44810 [Salmonella enterica subsp. enterica serovar Montevideo str. CDC 86-0391]ATQ03888.1 hypothetical protein CS348_18800 [Salmonella enterica subsp. enterica serovar Gaminara]ATT62554.1 hypothetical protein AW63_17950 [Salmonella enterica subsp. enterica serovar Montevideo str. USDA-ARS-USMARC-1900]ATT66888.1 hypothetical protein AW47_17665 [Salmonella enteric